MISCNYQAEHRDSTSCYGTDTRVPLLKVHISHPLGQPHWPTRVLDMRTKLSYLNVMAIHSLVRGEGVRRSTFAQFTVPVQWVPSRLCSSRPEVSPTLGVLVQRHGVHTRYPSALHGWFHLCVRVTGKSIFPSVIYRKSAGTVAGVAISHCIC